MARHHRMTSSLSVGRIVVTCITIALLAWPAQAHAARGSVAPYTGLSSQQRATLLGIARTTWKFYSTDVDSTTHLPMDNVTFAGGSRTPTTYGRYTSSANVGLYFWAVVAASDLGIISRSQAAARLLPTIRELNTMQRYDGFLYQWYDTTTGHVLKNPNDTDCSKEITPTFDNCYFISNVDNGLYVSGLIVARNALPQLRSQIQTLMAPVDFSIFYDARPETQCNVNADVVGNQPTGQMFGGVYVGLPVGEGKNWQHYYHNGALYSDPRISAYIGMGMHQMPGNVWWRSWRMLPPKQCATDPDFSWQGQPQTPGITGAWQMYKDPRSGEQFKVWEGHYTYPGSTLTFIPTFNGGMFEGLMDNQVVPETSWGPHSFGLNDLRWAQVQMKYATEQLHYKVWGISPSSTPDDTGDYKAYGAGGATLPIHQRTAICTSAPDDKHPDVTVACAPEDTVSPHASFIALDVLPKQAFQNIQRLRSLYPGVYGVDGFFDAVDPATGKVGHRYLVLDQSMIMAALDNAIKNRALQRHFAHDPVADAAHTYLSYETMSIH